MHGAHELIKLARGVAWLVGGLAFGIGSSVLWPLVAPASALAVPYGPVVSRPCGPQTSPDLRTSVCLTSLARMGPGRAG